MDREQAKELFLRLSFSGTVKAWATVHGVDPERVPAFVYEYAAEMAANVPRFLAAEPVLAAAATRGEGQGDASLFAIVVQEHERRCLLALKAAVERSGGVVGALIHDGLMVRRSGPDLLLPTERLREWERGVREATGFDVSLAEKPMARNPVYADGSPSTWVPSAPKSPAPPKRGPKAPGGPKGPAGPGGKVGKTKKKAGPGVGPVSARESAQRWMARLGGK